ncbi:MAG TPA: hypothetical protein VFN57_08805 [Thermomicrobiaceae bacterium]|nr:hypothetical protein [Thermomicrobiaceae bacterium]
MPTNTRKTRTKRDAKPRLSEAQLQAYRARQAQVQATAESAARTGPTVAPSPTSFSQWGRLDEEYAMIRSDLTRLGMITLAMLVLIIAATFVLH